MEEQQWLACTEPQQMLEFLGGKASDRKLRLFACACCGRVLQHQGDDHPALLVSERVADGLVGKRALRRAWRKIGGFGSSRPPASAAAAAVRATVEHEATTAARWAMLYAAEYFGLVGLEQASQGEATRRNIFYARKKAEFEVQAALLRDLFNRFRPVPLDPHWLAADVLPLAQAAYDNRTLPSGDLDPARLALLADALEDAGCDNADILGHLRSEGPHVRGCWVVDLLLGKE